MSRSLLGVMIFTLIIAAVAVILLNYWLSPNRYENESMLLQDASWLPQVVVTLIGLVGASWIAYRRLELLEESNVQRKEAADKQLAATERGNLNGAIKEADAMMAKNSLTSIIAGQRWLHHLAEDESLDPELIRSLLCAHIVGNDPVSTPHEAGADDGPVKDETNGRTRQAALEMIFGDPGRFRYSKCQNIPELGSCIWRRLNFTGLNAARANFRQGDFTNALISGTCFDESDLRETKWSGDFGGSARTSMRRAKMSGVDASSCKFVNFDFSEANMSNNGLVTRFRSCTFIDCDFTGARWSGAELDSPNFVGCKGHSFDHLRDAKLHNPSGLPEDVLEELRSKGLLNS